MVVILVCVREYNRPIPLPLYTNKQYPRVRLVASSSKVLYYNQDNTTRRGNDGILCGYSRVLVPYGGDTGPHPNMHRLQTHDVPLVHGQLALVRRMLGKNEDVWRRERLAVRLPL